MPTMPTDKEIDNATDDLHDLFVTAPRIALTLLLIPLRIATRLWRRARRTP